MLLPLPLGGVGLGGVGLLVRHSCYESLSDQLSSSPIGEVISCFLCDVVAKEEKDLAHFDIFLPPLREDLLPICHKLL